MLRNENFEVEEFEFYLIFEFINFPMNIKNKKVGMLGKDMIKTPAKTWAYLDSKLFLK